MENVSKIKQYMLKKQNKVENKNALQIAKLDDELFEIYYKNYELFRLETFGVREISDLQNKQMEVLAYQAWTEDIISNKSLRGKLDFCRILYDSGFAVGLTGMVGITAHTSGAIAPTVLSVGITIALVAIGLGQALKTKFQCDTELYKTYRSAYYLEKLEQSSAKQLCNQYRQQTLTRFKNTHLNKQNAPVLTR